MLWLSQLLKGAKLLQVIAKVKEEAPHVVPLLEALEANDYDRAADVVLSYGDAHGAQELLAKEVGELTEKIVAALPTEMQDMVKELLVGELSTEVQEKLLRAILSAGLKQADDLIPEEAILSALRVVGLT